MTLQRDNGEPQTVDVETATPLPDGQVVPAGIANESGGSAAVCEAGVRDAADSLHGEEHGIAVCRRCGTAQSRRKQQRPPDSEAVEIAKLLRGLVVDAARIELATSALLTRRSPS